jgi:hypothetical protein
VSDKIFGDATTPPYDSVTGDQVFNAHEAACHILYAEGLRFDVGAKYSYNGKQEYSVHCGHDTVTLTSDEMFFSWYNGRTNVNLHHGPTPGTVEWVLRLGQALPEFHVAHNLRDLLGDGGGEWLIERLGACTRVSRNNAALIDTTAEALDRALPLAPYMFDYLDRHILRSCHCGDGKGHSVQRKQGEAVWLVCDACGARASLCESSSPYGTLACCRIAGHDGHCFSDARDVTWLASHPIVDMARHNALAKQSSIDKNFNALMSRDAENPAQAVVRKLGVPAKLLEGDRSAALAKLQQVQEKASRDLGLAKEAAHTPADAAALVKSIAEHAAEQVAARKADADYTFVTAENVHDVRVAELAAAVGAEIATRVAYDLKLSELLLQRCVAVLAEHRHVHPLVRGVATVLGVVLAAGDLAGVAGERDVHAQGIEAIEAEQPRNDVVDDLLPGLVVAPGPRRRGLVLL